MKATSVIADCINSECKLILCGNGSLAAVCQHIAAEFIDRFILDKKPLTNISLRIDKSPLACAGDDYSFDEILSQHPNAISSTEECLMGISTSGNSKNIIRAVEKVKKNYIFTIGIFCTDGGKQKSLGVQSIVVDGAVRARIQGAHIFNRPYNPWCCRI